MINEAGNRYSPVSSPKLRERKKTLLNCGAAESILQYSQNAGKLIPTVSPKSKKMKIELNQMQNDICADSAISDPNFSRNITICNRKIELLDKKANGRDTPNPFQSSRL